MAQKKFDLTGRRVFVAGHRGLVGSAVTRRLRADGVTVETVEREVVDLIDPNAVKEYLTAVRPDVVIIAAARVGGIKANNERPVEFLAENLAIALNLIRSSHEINIEKLLYLGSTCIYPKFANQPMTEDQLLTGPLEPTNEWYAVAKIAGIKLCQAYRRQFGRDFISLMPTNLYGPGDNYHPLDSHVLPALIRRFHEAKQSQAPQVIVWGTGTPRREFLYVDDLADAMVFALENYSEDTILNVGVGHDISIRDLAMTVASAVGYTGDIVFDPSKPDGTPRKLVDVSRLTTMGWSASTSLSDGLKKTYADFLGGGGRNTD